jgi:putative ABC transport system ATP-binding protein
MILALQSETKDATAQAMEIIRERTISDVSERKIIELRDVSKIYSTGPVKVTALDHASLQIAPGDFVAIMGPSGSGKSTLMNLVGLLDRPTEGTILFEEQDLRGKGDNELARVRREKLGFIFQSFNLFPRISALKNVSMPLQYAGVSSGERSRRAKAMLEQMGLGDRLSNRPWELSGGQQQRVAIARALINNPVLILADEPTGNLDSKSGEVVLSLLQQLNDSGATIVVVTHDERVASHTKRIVRLLDGRIVEDSKLDTPLRSLALAGA